MKVVALISQKGGAGKTTIAQNLAVRAERAGYVTVVLDLDLQASMTKWSERRGEAPPEVIPAAQRVDRLSALLESLRERGCDWVFVDTAPNADRAANLAAKAADLVLIPCRPSGLDLDAIGASVDTAATLANKPSFVVLNACPPRLGITDDAEKLLAESGVGVCPHRVHQRQAFVNPHPLGQAGIEWEPKGKAAAEIEALWLWTCKQFGLPAKKTAGASKRKSAKIAA